MPLVILTALLPEARALARAFHLPRQFSHRISSHANLTIVRIGPRATFLDAIPALRPQALLMAGLAGALSPQLHVGDVVIQGPCPHLTGLSHPVYSGTLATADSIIDTPAAKAALFQSTGALAVDMETQLAQDLATAMGLPFLAVRAISDNASQTLDPALLTFLDPEGRPLVGRALRHLAAHPAKLPSLLQIRRATNLALSNLAATLRAIIAAGWPQKT